MPLLGFGTYQIPDDERGISIILEAFACGYKLLDCASFYRNESTIGKAISGMERETLYIVSKVWNDAIYDGPAAVRASCLKSIKDLGCKYLDLYLIHWPVPSRHVSAYHELIRLREEGLVRDIGVSNYTIEDMEELLESGISVIPAVNQIEINPFLNRKRTIRYFRDHGIVPMSFRGLRNATAFDDRTLMSISCKLGVTPAQILGRWLIQNTICHIPKSSKKARMIENSDIFGFNIPPEDMATLDSLTSSEALTAFRQHYLARIVRDTPLSIPESKDFTLD